MLKNHIFFALLFAICWNVKAEAMMGMSASKAFSHSNTVNGATFDGKRNTANPVVVKREEKAAPTHATYTITMNDKNSSKIEKMSQVLKEYDYLNVILPSFSWSVDSENCNETHTITPTRISFTIFGTMNKEPSCEIKLYGYDPETSQILNKIIILTVN